MTFAMDHCPLEVAARMFEIYLLFGEEAYVDALLKVFKLQEKAIMKKTDTDLINYI